MELLNEILGLDVTRLSMLQMGVRAIIVFVAGLIFVRVAGIRTFGKKSIFDQVTALILGTLLGNAIFNADIPFFPLLFSCLVFMLLHRVIAGLTFLSPGIGKVIKGEPISLIKKGVLQEKNMKKTLITKEDIEEGWRLDGHSDTSMVEESYLERSGKISFIKKEEKEE